MTKEQTSFQFSSASPSRVETDGGKGPTSLSRYRELKEGRRIKDLESAVRARAAHLSSLLSE